MKIRHIKKYANRRLYDTVDSKHITLADIRNLIVSGVNVQITDDTTGKDLTRQMLLQIIVDQEQDGEPILNETLLTQLIRFYGNPMQGMMSSYLQKSIDTFVTQQRSMQEQMQNMISGTPLATMQELMNQNLDTWQTMLRTNGQHKKPDKED